MKKIYTGSKIEIIYLNTSDVVTASMFGISIFDEDKEDSGSYLDIFG